MAPDKIVIYGHQASRASRPYWLLREYGMKFNEDFIEVDTGGPVTADRIAKAGHHVVLVGLRTRPAVRARPGAPIKSMR